MPRRKPATASRTASCTTRPSSARVDERKVQQPAQSVATVRLLQHRPEDGLGDPSHDRGRFEGTPCERVLDVVEVEPRQLFDDACERRVLEPEVGALGDAGGGEHQRERMPARDPVQPRRVARRDPEPLEQRARIGILERMQRHAAKPVQSEPPCDRALTSGQHEADAGRQRRHEHLAQPGVHEPEDLVMIERERDRRRETSQVPGKLGYVVEPADGLEETGLGRFDGSAVELDDARPALMRALDEGTQNA